MAHESVEEIRAAAIRCVTAARRLLGTMASDDQIARVASHLMDHPGDLTEVEAMDLPQLPVPDLEDENSARRPN